MRNTSLKTAHQLDNLLRRSFQLYHTVQLLQNMHTTNLLCLSHFRLRISFQTMDFLLICTIPCIANLSALKFFTCSMEEQSLHAWKSIGDTKYSFHSFDLLFFSSFFLRIFSTHAQETVEMGIRHSQFTTCEHTQWQSLIITIETVLYFS